MLDVKAFEKQLRDRLRELQERLVGIEADLDERPDPDMSEQAIQIEDDEVLESLGQAGVAEIKMIEAALGRIEDGSYGTCVACGEEISRERLEVLPHTPLCRNCA